MSGKQARGVGAMERRAVCYRGSLRFLTGDIKNAFSTPANPARLIDEIKAVAQILRDLVAEAGAIIPDLKAARP